jgi:pyruvyltransferase
MIDPGTRSLIGQENGSLFVKGLRYRVARDIALMDGAIPLTWWVGASNFGDLLSPWLINQMTSLPVVFSEGGGPCYIAIGSVIKRVKEKTVVWGSGSFGTEPKRQLCGEAEYRAVRGPLTRNKLVVAGIDCPRVYGDPALLLPFFFNREIEKTAEIGIVLRWSERKWNGCEFGAGVKKIYLKSEDVEGVLAEILSCKRIISSSLHGLIIADAYSIPNAWLASHTPKGGEFKFYDYFLSVNKIRNSFAFDFERDRVELVNLLSAFEFDSRPIEFDYEPLLQACPFLEPVS